MRSDEKIGAYGCLNTNRAVRSSGVSTRSIGPIQLAPGAPVCGSINRSIVARTACELNGVPSWNFTPGCSLNVITRPFSEIVHESARSGTKSPVFLSSVTSVS